MARDPRTLAQVCAVRLGTAARSRPPRPRLRVTRDRSARLDRGVAEALKPAVDVIEAAYGPATPVDLGDGKLADLYQAYRVLQGWEAWQAAGELIEGLGLRLGPDVEARFAFLETVTAGGGG